MTPLFRGKKESDLKGAAKGIMHRLKKGAAKKRIFAGERGNSEIAPQERRTVKNNRPLSET